MGKGQHILLGITAISGFVWACAPSLAGVSAERAQELEHLVRQDCGSCHGMTFKGGLGSPLTSEVIAERTDEALHAVIRDGVPGTPMPPWSDLLSDADIDWVISYLRNGGLDEK
jgi:cytochrome c55X